MVTFISKYFSAQVWTDVKRYSYNSTIFGPSGNITVNGTLTCRLDTDATDSSSLRKRGLGAGKQQGVNLNTPPYAIHNG